MDYEAVEERIKAGYREITAQYRKDDEVEVTTENHRRLGRILTETCRSFCRPIQVLDAGCGTGRYFHCLDQVERLVGLDISEEMLAAARHPVCQDQITAKHIELLRGNIYLKTFPPGTFDFIYSLGMFGHGCPVTVEVCNKFFEWLRPGGKLFFNIVDFDSLPLWFRARRRLRGLLYPKLNRRLQHLLDEREKRSPFFGLTKGELIQILGETRFPYFAVSSYWCQSPLWSGGHLECMGTKPVLAIEPLGGFRRPAACALQSSKPAVRPGS